MSDDHNIDRLFQESFKDFEVDAPKSTWRGIEKRLNQKSKRRVIPIWQKLSGAAAVIAIVILSGSQWFLNSDQIKNDNNSIVDNPQETFPNNNTDNEFNGIVLTNSDESQNEIGNSNNLEVNEGNNINPQSSSPQSSNQENLSNAIATTKTNKSQQNALQDNKLIKNPLKPRVGENLAYTVEFSSKNLIQSTGKILRAKSIQRPKKNLSQKKSLVEVAENLNRIEEANASNRTENSWFIKPQISPIFYGNLGNGSAVDPNLAQNESQGEVNVSYGVNVAYQINDKIKLRTGVNRVNLNYTTKNVYLLENQAVSNLSNINTNTNFNASVLSSQQLDNLTANGTVSRTETISSQLQQELGYIEIPMEVEYKILNTKIDINLVGGASTLLLNKNNLDIKNLNGTTSVGEANNLNNLSFSTNFAIGLDYNISERLMFNLEPTFKYQINTFQGGTTNFQPYFLGVYSGLVFKF